MSFAVRPSWKLALPIAVLFAAGCGDDTDDNLNPGDGDHDTIHDDDAPTDQTTAT